MESHTGYGIHCMSMFDADPFRNGTDCCCAVHTCAGRYKRSMNAIRDGGTDVQPLLDAREESYKGVLAAGCRMTEKEFITKFYPKLKAEGVTQTLLCKVFKHDRKTLEGWINIRP